MLSRNMHVYINSYFLMASLLLAVFYVPIINGRLLDVFYLLIIIANIKKIFLTLNELLIIATAFLNAGFLILTGVFYGNTEPYFTFFVLRLVILYLFYIKLIRINNVKLNNIIFIMLVINSISVILDFLHLPLTETFFRLIKAEMLQLEYRASGLFTGYYSAAIMISVMVAYVYYHDNIVKFIISLLLGSLALFLSGRSGFVVLILFFFYAVVNAVIYRKIPIKMLFATLLIVLSILLLSPLLVSTLPGYITETYILFSQITQIFTLKVEGTSMEPLFKGMYFLSDNWYEYIFGNNAKPFVSPIGVVSDSGYIQLLYGMGLIGTTLYFIFFLFTYFKACHPYSKLLFLTMLLLSIKGSLFYSYIFVDFLFIVISKDLSIKEEPDSAYNIDRNKIGQYLLKDYHAT